MWNVCVSDKCVFVVCFLFRSRFFFSPFLRCFVVLVSSSICCYLFVVHLKIDCIFFCLFHSLFFPTFSILFFFFVSPFFSSFCIGAAGSTFAFCSIILRVHRAQLTSIHPTNTLHTPARSISRYLKLCNTRSLYFSSKWIFKLDISLCKKAFRSSCHSMSQAMTHASFVNNKSHNGSRCSR